MMQVEAPAKVNLYLTVGERRADGYHNIRTIFHSISLADSLTIKPGDALEVICSDPEIPSGPENLVYRAAEALAQESGARTGARITVHKAIPSQAGLGGGSTDAAAALVALNRFWGVRASTGDLETLGSRLGADVPFCIRGGAAYAEGIGERLSPLPPLPEAWMVVLKPAAAVSTRAAYEALDQRGRTESPPPDRALQVVRDGNLDALASILTNDFEPPALAAYPEIARGRQALREHSHGVLLCGSGAALFGLMESEAAARGVTAALHQAGWNAWAARFVESRFPDG